MKLKTKLILGLGTIILIIILLSATVYSTLDRQNQSMREIVSDNYSKVMLAQQLKNETNIVSREMREYLLMDSEVEQSEKVRKIHQSLQSISIMFDTLKEISSDNMEKNSRIYEGQNLYLSYKELVEEVINLASTESPEVASQYLFEQSIRQEILEELDALVELEENANDCFC